MALNGILLGEEWYLFSGDNWYTLYYHSHALVGALIGLYATLNRGSGIELSDLPGSILERIHFFVDKSEEWLKRLVRILVNNNKWIHTQLV